MSRTRRLLVISAAWAIPVVWVVLALLAGPSDGTTISQGRPTLGADSWRSPPTVVRAYGDTQLRVGDTVLSIGGRTVEEWVASGEAPARSVGETVTYEVRRPAPDLDRELELDVRLTTYPVGAAIAANLPWLLLAGLLLVAGSVVFWARPATATARASLAAAALVPAGLTTIPLGLSALDLAGGRGVWPHLGGQIALALAAGSLLTAALAFPSPPTRLARHPTGYAAAYAVPVLGYAAWALLARTGDLQAAVRLETLTSVAAPAVIATGAVIPMVLGARYARSPAGPDRIALRLVLLALGGGLSLWLLLGVVPQQIAGDPLLPWTLLTVTVTLVVLGCLVSAALRYRLAEVEASVRRALVQALVATLVGGAFLFLVAGVNVASGTSMESMVAGGVVALLLLPLAIALQRTIRHLVYGPRDFPARLVAELRQSDPGTAPEEALRETLELLARRLRLAHASVEVFEQSDEERMEVSVGEPRGTPTTVDLVVAGQPLGRLSLEVDPGRDPFGRSDRRLLEDVGTQVGALVQAVAVSRQLQQSRQQLVTGREEERRRMRRDLHDGLGPSLASLAMGLEAAKDLIGDDPDQAVELVERLSERTRTEIGEVRRLVDGLRPPALDQFGLVSALRQRSDEHNLAARAARSGPGTVWVLRADEDVEPLPAAVEVAAYRIVVEAVNNAVRHSAANSCEVFLSREPHTLLVRITDSGVGVAETVRLGVGLSSMRERAEELGGTCAVSASPGGGTLIEARLPLEPSPPGRATRTPS